MEMEAPGGGGWGVGGAQRRGGAVQTVQGINTAPQKCGEAVEGSWGSKSP